MENLPTSPLVVITRMYRHILPLVKTQVDTWQEYGEKIPDLELRAQALNSLKLKKSHYSGGTIFATGNLNHKHTLVSLIISFQIICDYLDNLCDRKDSVSFDSAKQLHQSLLDAVSLEPSTCDYYKYFSNKNDGNYLQTLVNHCQLCLSKLPNHKKILPKLKQTLHLYILYQSYKQLTPKLMEAEVKILWGKYKDKYSSLSWYEFFNACGSTLPFYSLFLAASFESLTNKQLDEISHTYFPYISGLHVSLDYFIDQKEDKENKEFNTCFCYEDNDILLNRLIFLINSALSNIEDKNYKFHKMIINGLVAYYIADKKMAEQPELKLVAKKLIRKISFLGIFLYLNSLIIRKFNS